MQEKIRIEKSSGIFSNTTGDLAAGLVVFLIALPLCLGIALASGAPLYSGIIAGVVGGIVIGAVSKSNLSVSGPAAGLTAIVLSAINELGGAFDVFLCAVVIAGAIQIGLGFLKAGNIGNYIPSNVIQGMLAAIGVIIILKQVPHAIGFDKDYEGNFSFFDPTGSNTFYAIYQALNFFSIGAALIAIISIAILLTWEKVKPLKKLIFLPGPLVVVVVSIVLNEIFLRTGSAFTVEQEHLVTLPVANNIGEFFGQFVFPNFSGFANPQVWIIGATIGIVASIETLLSVEAVDRLDPLKRHTPRSHELTAQGVGNLVSGLLGGLPATSVIIRSSANVSANARTKLSTIAHGVLLLLCAALIPFLLNKIPLAALAAILILTGYKLAKPAVFMRMWKNGWYQFTPFIVTIVAIVFTDLLIGVALGLGVSIFFLLRENTSIPYFYRRNEYQEGEIIHIHLAQEVSFLNKAAILKTLENLPNDSYVILDAVETAYLDHDVCEIIQEFKDIKAAEKGIRLETVGFDDQYNIPNTLQKDSAYVQQIENGKSVFVYSPKKSHEDLIEDLINDQEVSKV